MIYLGYISTGMSVKEVSEFLGYKHDSIRSDIYKQLNDLVEVTGIKNKIKAANPSHKNKTFRFVKVKDVEPSELDSWLTTFSLTDTSFIPVCYVTNTKVIDQVSDERIRLFKSYSEEFKETMTDHIDYLMRITTPDNICVVDPAGRIRNDFRLRKKLKTKQEEVLEKVDAEIQTKFAKSLSKYIIEIDL